MAKPTVLIVGGGVFGTSTAYHLAQRGYNSVTVLDRFDAPSKDSAATDLNKVVRADYPNPLYAKLGMEATSVWKDPRTIFAGIYRESSAGRKGVKYMSADDLRSRWPALTGDFPDWTNLWSPAAGWVPSGQALLRMANAARAQGVRYISGGAGHVKKPLYGSDGSCIGVVSEDSTIYKADIINLASGSNTATLVEAKNEAEAQCSVICVIQLEPDEVAKYQDIPIIDDFEQGIIFPPDENGLIKLCSCRTITNYQNPKVRGASILHSLGDYPDDGCPKEIETEMRAFVREMIPELADRPFVSTKLCWDALSGDLNFRICPFPERKNLFVATMGSNHGFKFLPVIGKYVADMLEGKLGQEWIDLWSWKFGKRPSDFQDPHPYPQRDLDELTGWKGRNAPAKGRLPWTWSRL